MSHPPSSFSSTPGNPAASSAPPAVLRQEQFDTLRAIIYAHVGMHFPDGRKSVLESRLSRRIAELNLETFDQYVRYLTFAPDREAELHEMLSRVTVSNPSFFRDPEQLALIRDTALPAIINARRADRSLRLWVPACGTGQEAYTLAVLVHQALGERLPDWRIEILGTDMSAKALEQAREGRYTDDAFRAVDPSVRERYFQQDGPYRTPDAVVASMVSFDTHNLKDRLGAKRYGQWDAIVCRNAMGYFDDAMRARVAAMFAEQLRPDGLLILGAGESLEGLEVPFASTGSGPARCYIPAFDALPPTSSPSSPSASRPLRLA